MIARLDGIWTTYTVPENKRAIITSVLAFGLQANTASVFAQAHGYTFLNHVFLAAESTVSVSCRLPVYERETVAGLVYGVGTRLFISGYLLDDLGPGNPPTPTFTQNESVVPVDDELGEAA